MAEGRRPWLRQSLYWQSTVVSGLIGGFCVLALVGIQFSLIVQSIILLGGIVLIGFPHGAFDHLVARSILAGPLGQQWWILFVLLYCGLAGIVWLAWIYIPAVTLVVFLSATVLHFGLGDIDDGLAPASVPRMVTILTYGGLPVLLPLAFHSSEAAPTLAAMAGMTTEFLLSALSVTRWLLPLWIMGFVWVTMARLYENNDIFERSMMVCGFLLLPPLLAFGLYFGFGHSVRHVLRVGAWYDPYRPRVAACWAMQIIIPASIVCSIGIALLSLVGSDITTGLISPVFQIIAALTFPHMIVTYFLDKSTH